MQHISYDKQMPLDRCPACDISLQEPIFGASLPQHHRGTSLNQHEVSRGPASHSSYLWVASRRYEEVSVPSIFASDTLHPLHYYYPRVVRFRLGNRRPFRKTFVTFVLFGGGGRGGDCFVDDVLLRYPWALGRLTQSGKAHEQCFVTLLCVSLPKSVFVVG